MPPKAVQSQETPPHTAVPEWWGRGRRPTKERPLAGEPEPQRVDAIAATVPADEWKVYRIKEGSKGPGFWLL